MQKKNKIRLLLLVCIVLCIFGFLLDGNTPSAKETSISVQTPESALEIPQLSANRKECLLRRVGYTVSFNPEWNIPNWVAYELTEAETYGKCPRADHFVPDPDIPDCPNTRDYTRSGWDRGHMAPAADMKWNSTAMRESFYLSNICPQNHNLNKGDWKQLEETVRDMARSYGSVYVCCGPVLTSADNFIGNQHRIAVPQAFFKALLWQAGGQWSAAGFYFKNMAGHQKLETYTLTLDELEEYTGIDFFPSLDDAVEKKVESELNVSFLE